jgi:hypothetical protein
MHTAKPCVPTNFQKINIFISAGILCVVSLKLKPRLRVPGKYVFRKEYPLSHMLSYDSTHSLQREVYRYSVPENGISSLETSRFCAVSKYVCISPWLV